MRQSLPFVPVVLAFVVTESGAQGVLPVGGAAAMHCVEDMTQYNICLNVEGFEAETMQQFATGRQRWESAIDGHLGTVSMLGLDRHFLCNPYPSRIDDMYMCAKGVQIDGVGGIIGHSLVAYHRRAKNLVTMLYHDLPLVGYMEFDTSDAGPNGLGSRFQSVIEHEMGHVLGVHGYFWQKNRIMHEDGTYHGGNVIREWQRSGCPGNDIPLDAMSSHWSEDIFVDEIMTEYFGECDYCPLSTVTIGSLEDLGYRVNYAAADQQWVPLCHNNDAASGRPSLSAEGRAIAVAYGQEVLRKSAENAPLVRETGGKQKITYSADLFVDVIYEEGGYVFGVEVVPDMVAPQQ